MARLLAYLVILLALLWAALHIYTTGKVTPETTTFGSVSLTLDYATTSAERERGLGGRTSVAEGYGMLFVFPTSDYYGFWMKDMLVPIDIFWLDENGRVVSIAADAAISTYPTVFYPSSPARYVLETAAGFAGRHGIATGTPLILKKFPSVSS